MSTNKVTLKTRTSLLAPSSKDTMIGAQSSKLCRKSDDFLVKKEFWILHSNSINTYRISLNNVPP